MVMATIRRRVALEVLDGVGNGAVVQHLGLGPLAESPFPRSFDRRPEGLSNGRVLKTGEEGVNSVLGVGLVHRRCGLVHLLANLMLRPSHRAGR